MIKLFNKIKYFIIKILRFNNGKWETVVDFREIDKKGIKIEDLLNKL